MIPLPAKTIIIQYRPFHALLGAFVVIIFVQCTVASAPTPSAALPCSGLCNSETDLNTVSTVIVPLNTVQCLHCHSGPLSNILSQCLLSSESPGWPVQLWQTVIPSPVQHSSFFPSLAWCTEGTLTGWKGLIRDITQSNLQEKLCLLFVMLYHVFLFLHRQGYKNQWLFFKKKM